MISSISRWDGSRSVNRKDAFICGDAISDLRTTNNELSVWKADTQEDIEDAIVALALNRDSVSKLSYFLLEEDELEKIEIVKEELLAYIAINPELSNASLNYPKPDNVPQEKWNVLINLKNKLMALLRGENVQRITVIQMN